MQVSAREISEDASHTAGSDGGRKAPGVEKRRQPLRAGKGKKTDSLQLPKGHPAHTLILAQAALL